MSRKSTLMGRTALPLVAAVGIGVIANPAALPHRELVTPANAQSARPANPCAPAASRRTTNPCAPANPCAAAPARAAPARAAPSPANPCAPRAGITGNAANPFDVPAGYTQAPFGDKMPDIVANYLRAAPYVGTGGLVVPGSMTRLRDLGFKTVINLLTEKEGAEKEGAEARAAGLAYVNLPVAQLAPGSEQVAAFARLVNDPTNYPILLHCESANRVGALWALYRAGAGIPPEIAVQEGRTVGLKPNREKAVREMLGLPPL